MSEKKESRVIHFFKNTFRFRFWLDFDRIKNFTLYVVQAIKKMFVPDKAEVPDTEASFADAMKAQHLTEKSIVAQRQSLYRLSILMCVLAFGIFAYTIYLIIYAHYLAAGISFIMFLLGLVLAFRFHFWYFQIRERRLGCSFEEWFQQGLLGKKHEKNSP